MRTNVLPSPRRQLDLTQSRDIINFYSDPVQRRRAIVGLDLTRSQAGLVLATPRHDVGYFSQELKQAGVSILNVSLVEITPDWRRAISHILDACLHAQQTHRAVHLVADFAGEVHYQAIYELESLLRTATREWNVACVTQYDARSFSEAIDVDALSQFGIVLFGSYFQDTAAHARPDRQADSVQETADMTGD